MPDNPFAATYINADDADLYFQTRLDSGAWDDASFESRTKALYEATRRIDRLNFAGKKTDAAQVLEFPRDGNTAVPQDILIAACEIAFCLLDGVDVEMEMKLINTTSQSFDTVHEVYDRFVVREHIRAGIPSAVAWTHLRPYLQDTFQISLVKV